MTWRVPEYTHLTVLADLPAQAIELALATVVNNPDAHERTLHYESSGADVITVLSSYEEPYPDPPGSTLPLPQTPDQDLESAIEAAVAHVRKGSSAPVELHNLLTTFDASRRAR